MEEDGLIQVDKSFWSSDNEDRLNVDQYTNTLNENIYTASTINKKGEQVGALKIKALVPMAWSSDSGGRYNQKVTSKNNPTRDLGFTENMATKDQATGLTKQPARYKGQRVTKYVDASGNVKKVLDLQGKVLYEANS